MNRMIKGNMIICNDREMERIEKEETKEAWGKTSTEMYIGKKFWKTTFNKHV